MVIGENDELINNIYNAYLVALKMLNYNYQVIVNTTKINFSGILNILNKTLYDTNNAMQKKFINEYKQYLFDLSKEVQIFSKSYYFVINKLKESDENKLKESFNNVKHLGINIRKITDDKEIFKLLYENINRVLGGYEVNECN